MGETNSSITRAWPIFGALFGSDSSGQNWLNPMLEMCQRPILPGSTGRSSGNIDPSLSRFERPLPGAIKSALGLPSENSARLRNCFEKPLAPPTDFLGWLIQNPDKMRWPTEPDEHDKTIRAKLRYGKGTQTKREALFSGDAKASSEALEELQKHGSEKSERRWWAFEGFTCVDVYVETASMILLVECKRNELLSPSTAWYRARNQLGRNLEVAKEQAARKGKNYAVIVCSENVVSVDDKSLEGSFPHISNTEELYQHYWGNVLWKDIHSQLCNNVHLPDTVVDAIDSGIITKAIEGL